jgi:hypothetical protein
MAHTPRINGEAENGCAFYSGDDIIAALAQAPSAVRKEDFLHYGTPLPPAA